MEELHKKGNLSSVTFICFLLLPEKQSKLDQKTSTILQLTSEGLVVWKQSVRWLQWRDHRRGTSGWCLKIQRERWISWLWCRAYQRGWLTQSLFDGGEFAIDAGAFAHVIPVRLLGW